MADQRWNERFFSSTRGRIVALLRRANATVNDLAAALGLTDNAVRVHLTALERDGLVRQEGIQRGERKPAHVYALTPSAEQLFPKPYAAVFDTFLDVLTSQIGPDAVRDGLVETGRRLARGHEVRDRDVRQRAEHAVAVLNAVGGLAELEEGPEGLVLQGYSCPLAAIVPNHPNVCELAESLLTGITGIPVQEQCNQESPPRCRFVLLPGDVENECSPLPGTAGELQHGDRGRR